jgi:endonuclease YncB( thermonuclease family)
MVEILGTILIFVATAWQGDGATWTGKAEVPIDGDTLRVRDQGGRVHKVRILGIDAPDEGQRFFSNARDHLGKLTKGREVVVSEVGNDSAGRIAARVRISDHDLALDMLTAGLAWYHRSTVDDPALEAEERRAKARNVGLWIDKDPQPPWEWRASLERRRKAVQSAPAPQP